MIILFQFIALIFLSATPSLGQEWRTLEGLPKLPPGGQRYENLFFLDENRGWVVRGSRVFRTKDGGNTWQLFLHPDGGFRSVVFVDSLQGWLGGLSEGAPLHATTDGGETSQAIPFPDHVGICGLSSPSKDVIYGAGRYYGPATVVKSVDGGNTWTSIDLSHLASGLVDCHFTSADSGMVFGGVGQLSDRWRAIVLATSDGGATWEVRHYNEASDLGWCWKVDFPTTLTGYATVESANYFLKTTDGGLTWIELPLSKYQQGVGFATALLGWIGGVGGLDETRDGGLTWERDVFGNRVNSIHMLRPDLGYAVGNAVYKYSTETAVKKATISELKVLYR